MRAFRPLAEYKIEGGGSNCRHVRIYAKIGEDNIEW
jgi:hypothetical protein